jgi:hypothetical protein
MYDNLKAFKKNFGTLFCKETICCGDIILKAVNHSPCLLRNVRKMFFQLTQKPNKFGPEWLPVLRYRVRRMKMINCGYMALKHLSDKKTNTLLQYDNSVTCHLQISSPAEAAITWLTRFRHVVLFVSYPPRSTHISNNRHCSFHFCLPLQQRNGK